MNYSLKDKWTYNIRPTQQQTKTAAPTQVTPATPTFVQAKEPVRRSASFADMIRSEKVHQLGLKKGDTLLVTIGGYIGEEDEPWLPSQDDLMEAKAAWDYALEGLGVRCIVTHMMVKPTVIRKEDRAALREYEQLREEDP